MEKGESREVVLTMFGAPFFAGGDGGVAAHTAGGGGGVGLGGGPGGLIGTLVPETVLGSSPVGKAAWP